jgi:DcaP outer membrane protein
MKNHCIACLALVLLLSWAVVPQTVFADSNSADPTVDDLMKQVNQLRDQIAVLQAKLQQLETSKSVPATPAAAAASTSASSPQAFVGSNASQDGTIRSSEPIAAAQPSKEVGAATSTYTEFGEDTAAAPRFDNVPLDPKYQGFFRLPGTQTILKIGGYFKTDFMEDLKPAGNNDAFVPSAFPVPQVSGVYNSNVSIRPTRLSLDFRIPTTKIGEVRFYVEGDLFGSNSTTPRLRHAYAQARNVLIGQTFSNFMDPDGFPDTLDFQGPNGMVSIRNPQFRYGMSLHSGTTLYISIEKPSSDVIFATPQFSSQPNAPAPDGAIRLRQEFERGHVQGAFIFRDIAAFLPNGKRGSVFGWGGNASLGLKTFGKDNIILAAAAGHGISRYIQDTSGLGIDAEPASAANPHLEATPAVGVEASYQHYWFKGLRSSAVYSYAAVNNTDLATATTYNHSTYTAGNVIWNPYGSLNLGAEFLYGWKMLQNGQKANVPRIQFSAKYSFVKIDADRQ